MAHGVVVTYKGVGRQLLLEHAVEQTAKSFASYVKLAKPGSGMVDHDMDRKFLIMFFNDPTDAKVFSETVSGEVPDVVCLKETITT